VTVYPFLIRFSPDFTLTGYGLMMMVAFLVGGWALAREVRRREMPTAIAWDTVVAAIIGGLVGAKVYYAALLGRLDALVSRGGLVWYGGFIGGFLAVMGYWWWSRKPLRPLLDAISPALVAGYLLGRVGCFLVGDDYGVPTDLPWGIAFPRGSPPSTAQVLANDFHVSLPAGTPSDRVLAVHPTQLYEVALAFVILNVLWRVRIHRHAAGWLFGLYLVLTGLERFFVEFVRAKDDRLLGPLSLAQGLSALSVVIGLWLLKRWAGTEPSREAGASLPMAA
jgi:phosphatidylglycerol:prolipoprotein diacylglycerol transferase